MYSTWNCVLYGLNICGPTLIKYRNTANKAYSKGKNNVVSATRDGPDIVYHRSTIANWFLVASGKMCSVNFGFPQSGVYISFLIDKENQGNHCYAGAGDTKPFQ